MAHVQQVEPNGTWEECWSILCLLHWTARVCSLVQYEVFRVVSVFIHISEVQKSIYFQDSNENQFTKKSTTGT